MENVSPATITSIFYSYINLAMMQGQYSHWNNHHTVYCQCNIIR